MLESDRSTLVPFAARVLEWVGEPLMAPPGPRCALVGSGECLANRSLGADIDAHDVVIRVNRLPVVITLSSGDPKESKQQREAQDLGRRTDVLFSYDGLQHIDKGFLLALGLHFGPAHRRVHVDSSSAANCSFVEGAAREGPPCPFRAYAATRCYNGRGWRNMPFRPPQLHAPPALGCLRDAVADATQGASLAAQNPWPSRGGAPYVPTTGLVAVLAFSRACSVLDLFGFSGEKYRWMGT